MNITNNLRLIMAEQKINSVTELIKLSGLSRNAINKLYHDNEVETVKLETLIQLCDTLKIPLSRLIEYTPKQD